MNQICPSIKKSVTLVAGGAFELQGSWITRDTYLVDLQIDNKMVWWASVERGAARQISPNATLAPVLYTPHSLRQISPNATLAPVLHTPHSLRNEIYWHDNTYTYTYTFTHTNTRHKRWGMNLIFPEPSLASHQLGVGDLPYWEWAKLCPGGCQVTPGKG